MSDCTQLLTALKNGTHDQALAALYALDGAARKLDEARARAVRTVEAFAARYGADAQGAALFSGPGRTEIGGNHTDHQHGHVLCGSVDLDMLACAAPNGTRVVRIQSEGYPVLEISLDDLAPKKEEENTSAALVRGVAAKIAELGYTLSGFDACATSTVLFSSLPPPMRRWWAISSTISAVGTSWMPSPSPRLASTPKTSTLASSAD